MLLFQASLGRRNFEHAFDNKRLINGHGAYSIAPKLMISQIINKNFRAHLLRPLPALSRFGGLWAHVGPLSAFQGVVGLCRPSVSRFRGWWARVGPPFTFQGVVARKKI